ncbi:D-alanyl-D-alanine carboxypeptidase family protein [Blautia sp.]|uniref:D-alanyl-D-alanine carboxypeptidase family protein n=1 Tax=Blautia sp. TaxID=1955243 RepID=UPI003AB697AD
MAGKKKKISWRNRIICLVAEILAVIALLLVFSQNFGFGYQITVWVNQLIKPAVKELDITGINSSYAVLMQAGSGRVVGDINGETPMYPASMTKIMTTIVAIENLSNLNQEITVTNDMIANLYAQDATQAGFQPGETVQAIDLLYGVMLPSGADCCIALADTIAGSEEGFVELMNQKAEKLGLENTHFCNTTGLHADDHYSTAKDIAELLRYALKNSTFREIIESPYHSTPGTNVHPDGITFYSTMFKNLSDTTVIDGKIMGGKTGFTSEAGCCLASFAEIDDIEYILVTAGAYQAGTPHIDDAVKLYNRLGEASSVLYGR